MWHTEHDPGFRVRVYGGLCVCGAWLKERTVLCLLLPFPIPVTSIGRLQCESVSVAYWLSGAWSYLGLGYGPVEYRVARVLAS